MSTATYLHRRGQIQTYFDRTAVDAWRRLTSDAPVGSIRATVRAGRNEMRAALLSWLPDDLSGSRLLDAGCGTGALSIEAARRGADVVGVDLAPTIIEMAEERMPAELHAQIRFHAGDMLDPHHGAFDHVVAMDSIIHYEASDVTGVLAGLASRTRRSIAFTFAPRTPLLAAMHSVGRLFPRGDRAPAIEPVAEANLRRLIATDPRLEGWTVARTHRVTSGFYISQGMELVRT
jgi:magnesium-protoporphyrin O-methyltransferase